MSCGTCGIQASNTMQKDTGVPAGAPQTQRPRCPDCKAFVAREGAECHNPNCPRHPAGSTRLQDIDGEKAARAAFALGEMGGALPAAAAMRGNTSAAPPDEPRRTIPPPADGGTPRDQMYARRPLAREINPKTRVPPMPVEDRPRCPHCNAFVAHEGAECHNPNCPRHPAGSTRLQDIDGEKAARAAFALGEMRGPLPAAAVMRGNTGILAGDHAQEIGQPFRSPDTGPPPGKAAENATHAATECMAQAQQRLQNGDFAQAVQGAAEAVAHAEVVKDGPALRIAARRCQVEVLQAAGTAAIEQEQDLDRALELAAQRVAAAQALHNLDAQSTTPLAQAHFDHGGLLLVQAMFAPDATTSETATSQALAAFTTARTLTQNDWAARPLYAQATNALAGLQALAHQNDEAMPLYQEAISAYADCRHVPGMRVEEARARTSLGLLQFQQGDFTTAKQNYQQAITLYTTAHEPRGVAVANYYLYRLASRTGQNLLAQGALLACQDACRQAGLDPAHLEATIQAAADLTAYTTLTG